MNLIERYVHDVGRRLPRRQRADVEAELSSLLQDTLEDRVQGKPTEEDVIALLKEFGPPEKVAASYRPSGQYLIGPELYPTFKLVIGAVLLGITIALAVANVVGLIFSPAETINVGEVLLKFLGSYFQALLGAFASVVLVFAILQRLEVRPDVEEDEWDPRDLPEVKDYDIVGRGETAAGIAFTVVFLVLLNVFSDRIGLVFTFGLASQLSNIVSENLAWLNTALLLGLGLNLLLLWQGRWHLFTRLAKIGIDLLWLYIIYQVVTDLAANKASLAEAGLPDPLPSMMVLLGYGFLALVTVVIVIDAGKWIYWMLRRPSSEPQIDPKPGTDSLT